MAYLRSQPDLTKALILFPTLWRCGPSRAQAHDVSDLSIISGVAASSFEPEPPDVAKPPVRPERRESLDSFHRKRAPRQVPHSIRTTARPRPLNSCRAGSVKPWRRPSEGMPVAAAPGRYAIRRTSPVPSGHPMRDGRFVPAHGDLVTVGLVALRLVPSMVRAPWSEARAGQTVVGPMPARHCAGARAAPPTPAPAAPIEERPARRTRSRPRCCRQSPIRAARWARALAGGTD